jgi:hypothetical protein
MESSDTTLAPLGSEKLFKKFIRHTSQNHVFALGLIGPFDFGSQLIGSSLLWSTNSNIWRRFA